MLLRLYVETAGSHWLMQANICHVIEAIHTSMLAQL
jgi:hypothetical protein